MASVGRPRALVRIRQPGRGGWPQKVRRRRSDEIWQRRSHKEGPTKKGRQRREGLPEKRRSIGKGPPENVHQRRSNREGSMKKGCRGRKGRSEKV